MNKTAKRQTGFSLVEVLFAVMILSMGLIFVAAQFPVGLMIAKDTAEDTLNDINAHNAHIMIELENQAAVHRVGGTSPQFNRNMDTRDNGGDYWVHPQVTPNVFADTDVVTIDDPENYEYHILNTLPGNVDPEWSFWSRTTTNPYNYNPNEYENTSDIFIGDIGPIMYPVVDESTPDVIEKLPTNYKPMDADHRIDYLHPAMFQVAMTRSYCWKALYQRNPTVPNEYTFYIFTLRCTNKSARYALQRYNGSNPAVLVEEALPNTDYDTDRRFPVPWKIMLNTEIDPTNTSYFPVNMPWDRFVLNNYTDNTQADEIANILRAGSILIDARYGYLYEILEVNQTNNGWEVRLRTELHDTEFLKDFWLFPPAIERMGANYTFAEQQPVMQVTEKIVRF